MLVFFLIYILICVWHIKIRDAKGIDYLSFEQTQSIKGIFILLVFFSHFNSYVTFSRPLDVCYQEIVAQFGQTMVTLFMFYSGYGVMESVKKKGYPYIEQMPVKRILSTLFKFDIAVVIYALLSFGLGERISVKQFALSLVAWDSVGNSNWYIFAILVLYIFTYLAFKLSADKSGLYLPVFCVFVLTCAYIYFLAHFQIKEIWWYDTVMCYVFGMFYSLFRTRIEQLINKDNIHYLVATGFMIITTMYFKMHSEDLRLYLLLMLSFTALVIVFSMRISLENKVLRWCGTHLFEIYIMQRIPMMIFQRIGVASYNIYVYFILCLVITFGIVVIFKKYSDVAWSKVIEIVEKRRRV